MTDTPFDPDMYTKMLNITSPYHRSVYPSVSATNPSLSLAGKVVLVTGASRGVGFGIAPVFAEAGATGIVVTARKLESLDAVIKAIKEKGEKTEVLPLACDVSNSEAVRKMFSEIKEKFGRLDVVVANAGVMSQQETFPKIGDEESLKVWEADIVCSPSSHPTLSPLQPIANRRWVEHECLRHLLHRPALHFHLRRFRDVLDPNFRRRSHHYSWHVCLRRQQAHLYKDR
jgi:NAD(P)-dependent dehydrogenase (short-subunit alcohol dehydrogenase family)